MSDLNPKQTEILKHAAGYIDGAIMPLPEGLELSGGAVSRTLGVLRKKGFVDKNDDGVWRVTDSGREAVGAPAPTMPHREAQQPVTGTPRAGSKQARLVELLQRPEGASIAEIQSETSWQAHSVRGAISGVCKKKLGLTIVSVVEDDRGRVYRIEGTA